VSKRKLYVINPYNLDYIKKVEMFEQEYNIDKVLSNNLLKISETIEENDYMKMLEERNEIDIDFYYGTPSKIEDICHAHFEKDIKKCHIYLVEFKNSPKKRILLGLITAYAIESLGMQEVFITTDIKNKNLCLQLKQEGYENLGEENNTVSFLKEATIEM